MSSLLLCCARPAGVRGRGLAGRCLAAALVGVLTAGCSGSDPADGEQPGVDRAEVEQEVRARLGELVGREPEAVACPGDLPAEVGRTLRCTLTDAGTSLGVTVTVTGVDGDRTDFDVDLDDAPRE